MDRLVESLERLVGEYGDPVSRLEEGTGLTPSDKKVIVAFTEKKAAKGKKISTNGTKLDGEWMGGKGIAEWKSGKIHFNDLGSKAAQMVQKAIRKEAPKNWIAEGVMYEAMSPDQTIRALHSAKKGYKIRVGDEVVVVTKEPRPAQMEVEDSKGKDLLLQFPSFKGEPVYLGRYNDWRKVRLKDVEVGVTEGVLGEAKGSDFGHKIRAKVSAMGGDEKDAFEELYLIATNDGASYARKDGKGAAKKAVKEYLKLKAQYHREIADDVEPLLGKLVDHEWRYEK